MTPTTTWGSSFLTQPLASRTGATYRVMASKNTTTVDINGSPVATLNADQHYETILTTASLITANKPVQVMQYSNGSEYDGVSADPMDITIPPTDQFLNSYTIATEPTGADAAIHQNYLNIVAPTSEVSGIDLDGSDFPSSDFTVIPGSSYSGASVKVTFGSHTVSAPSAFGLTVYGFGTYDAYGYPAGFGVGHVVAVKKVTLAPTTSTHTVGTSACETATVTNATGGPVSGIGVNFTVKGVNPTSGFADSGTNGVAQFCYTGAAAGSDTETAEAATVVSNTAAITWATTTAATKTTTTLSGGEKTGTSISVPAGTPVTDQATLTGANASKATGTVTYTVYSNSACTTVEKAGTPEKITTAGTLPASSPVTITTAGTYYWKASYSGDPANAKSTSLCGTTGEVETVTPATTKTTTSLSGGGKTGTSISVPTDTPVTDQATLTGANASKATGTVTYTVYSNASCTTSVGTSTTKSITTPGLLPASNALTLSTAGLYYWKAAYNGDSANAPSASTCGPNGEIETVKSPAAATTKTTTSLSGGGKTGTSISVPTGTPVTDQGTLSGTNASTATGTVTYTVYSNTTCKTAVGPSTTQPITTPGKLPASNPVTLNTPGTYYWQASYSGDSANAKSTSPCGATGEVETVTSPTVKVKPTKLKTSLLGKGIFGGGLCWWLGDSITVFAGAQVTDSATLSGPNASTAGGTVTYTVYSLVKTKKCHHHEQWEAVASGGTVNVGDGSVPNSNPVTLPVGTYEWQASYSGDSLNAPSKSPFGSETETVISVPKCPHGWELGYSPCCKPSFKGH